ncbi:NCS2 family permease [bacterium]|nr:NCS2 family permease [bacterium]
MTDFLERAFRLSANSTTVRTEVLAGVTTFMTMAYIIVVNPAILASANGARMDFGAVMVATCLAAAFGTIVMGVVARYPIALAPGMGLNAFFSYEICNAVARLQAEHKVAEGVEPWQIALGMVFISGVIFTILTTLRIRKMVVNAVPGSLKIAIAAGIGFFIAVIGLMEAGVIVAHPVTFVQLGDVLSAPTLLAIFGVALTAALLARGVRGAILIGLVATGLGGIPLGIVSFSGGVVSAPPTLSTFGELRIVDALSWPFVAPILMLLFVDMFDTIGTLVGVTHQGGMLRKGELPRASRALASDAIATMGGAVLGTSTVTSYVESAAGVSAGGRTGLANVVTAALFLVAIFFSPIVAMFGASVPSPADPNVFLRPVTAPALILVGFLMMRGLRSVDWDDLTESLPVFLTILVMPLTFSISHGFAAGFVSYALVKLAAGKRKDVHPLVWGLAGIFVARYVFLPIHL